MQTFEDWWEANKHMLPHIVKIDAREAYNAALTAANKRIKELEAGLDTATEIINSHVAELVAERAISDKLEKALTELADRSENFQAADIRFVEFESAKAAIHAARAALTEVAAMRKGAEHD